MEWTVTFRLGTLFLPYRVHALTKEAAIRKALRLSQHPRRYLVGCKQRR